MNVAELSDMIGLPPELFNRYPHQLSGGQCQRITIARALARNQKVLILDEATSALDAKTEHVIMENIKARKLTAVIVAHRLSTVRDCDCILVLDNGKISLIVQMQGKSLSMWLVKRLLA